MLQEYSAVPEEHRAGARRRRAVVLRQRPDVRGLEARLLLRRQGARVRLRPGSAPGEQRTRWHPGPGRHRSRPNPSPTAPLQPDEAIFILESLLCTTPQPPPQGVNTDHRWSIRRSRARQQLEMHRTNPQCAACHALFDPLGLALEHFDPIGQYRDTENGLAIDATGSRAWHGLRRRSAARRSAAARAEGARLLDAQLLPQRERPRGR